jgi:hypothetical protein
MTAVLNEEYRRKALEIFRRPRRAENMADAALFLLSEKANYITGQVIQVMAAWRSEREVLVRSIPAALFDLYDFLPVRSLARSDRFQTIESISSRFSWAEIEWYRRQAG